MKLATVEAFFPELPGGDCNKIGRGEGANAKAAISRAFGNVFKQLQKKRKGAKRAGGRRFTLIKATITLIDKKVLEGNLNASEADSNSQTE